MWGSVASWGIMTQPTFLSHSFSQLGTFSPASLVSSLSQKNLKHAHHLPWEQLLKKGARDLAQRTGGICGPEIRFFDPQSWLPPEQVHCQFSRLLVPHHWSFLRRFKKTYYFSVDCVSVWAYATLVQVKVEAWVRCPKALELELQVDVSLLMWVQGILAPPSGRAGSPLNCRAIFPAQKAFACLFFVLFSARKFHFEPEQPSRTVLTSANALRNPRDFTVVLTGGVQRASQSFSVSCPTVLSGA